MSEIKDKLIGPKNIRSQIIKVVVLSVVLICAFAFSTLLYNLLFGGLRTVPSTPYDDADYQPLIVNPIPIPFNISDLLDFFQSLGLEIDEDMLETLLDMYDGNFDDIPLDDLAGLMNEMMFSEIEVFRVYNYTSTPLADMEKYLWKYECFDQYISGTWSSSVGVSNLNFYTWSEYESNDFLLNDDILMVKMLNITPNVGDNRMTLPTLFSTPYIMENSVFALNMDYGALYLRKQDYNLNGTALRASFNDSALINLSYSLASDILRPAADINASCEIVTNPNAQYLALLNNYLQLDGGSLANFISNHLDFQDHYNYLNDHVINSGDNAFIRADKIRNYLQYNFNLSYNPVPETEPDQDPINWFCCSQEGMYSDFASTFVAFTRAFGVVSRFVDGFNSRVIDEFSDPVYGNGFAVKYRNLYSWAEIFIPMDIYGNGEWVQMDVLFENFMGNPLEPVYGNSSYSLNVSCTNLLPSYPVAERNDWVTITARLLNDSLPMSGEMIMFTDITSGEIIGSNTTSSSGEASVFVQINDTMVVGPHVIAAQYNPQVANITYFVINDTVVVELNQVDPPSINLSDSSNNTIHVQGRVHDPLNDKGVPYSNVNIVLFQNGTDNFIFHAFQPSAITTDASGFFNAYLQGDPAQIFPGDYEVRADFNGTHNYTITWYGYEHDIPLIPSMLNNSSERLPLHVDRELTVSVRFYIDELPTNYPASPIMANIVTRGSMLTLKALVLNETGGAMQGVSVDFFNYTGGNSLIGSNTTDLYGVTTYKFVAGDGCLVGPNLLYAKVQNSYNYSYYILNELPNITGVSGPLPLVINKTNNEHFTITGYLNDTVSSLPLNYSDVELRIFRNGIDEYSFYLTDHANPFSVDASGMFSVTFGVNPAIPPGNYSLRLDFNGTFNLNSFPYSYDFYLPYINTSVVLLNELEITYEAPTILNFWINDMPSYQWEDPKITRYEDLNLTARLLLGDTPLSGKIVEFYDITQDILIGTIMTDLNGYASTMYGTNASTIAGVHLLQARYTDVTDYYNHSYFVLDAPINITINSGPSPNIVNCTSSTGRTFEINGHLNDSLNGDPIKYGSISVHLFSGTSELTPLTTYLNLIDGSTNSGSSGMFNMQLYVNSALTRGNYTLKVYFNGTFLYSFPNNQYNEHNFYMSWISNFSCSTNLISNLTIEDPEDVRIYVSVENNPTVYPYSSYYDAYLPERYNRGDEIHLQIGVWQSGNWTETGTVYVYDDIDGVQLASYAFTGTEIPKGHVEVNISSTNDFHSGIYRLRIQYNTYDSINITYIIINESITITPNLDDMEIQRGLEIDQSLIATISSPGSGTIEGLRINLTLLDSNYNDVSDLYLDLQGMQPITISNNQGTFVINSILQNCPYGVYYLRIDFNGSLQDTWLNLSDYMVHSNSSFIKLNITAGTTIIEHSWYTDYEVPPYDQQWVYNTTLYVNGHLRWDNGTAIQNVQVTIVVQFLDGTEIATNSTVLTDSNGNFSGTFFIDLNWPDYRNETEIWVYYTPIESHVESSQLEFTDW